MDAVYQSLLAYALLVGFLIGVAVMMFIWVGVRISRSRTKPLRRQDDVIPEAEEIDWADGWKYGYKPDGSRVDDEL